MLVFNKFVREQKSSRMSIVKAKTEERTVVSALEDEICFAVGAWISQATTHLCPLCALSNESEQRQTVPAEFVCDVYIARASFGVTQLSAPPKDRARFHLHTIIFTQRRTG